MRKLSVAGRRLFHGIRVPRSIREPYSSLASAFSELKAEFLSIAVLAPNKGAHSLAQSVLEKESKGEALTPDDIRCLETALVRLEPVERLKEYLVEMRLRYASLVGLEPTETKQQIVEKSGSEAEIRAEAEQMLSNLHQIAIETMRREELAAHILWSVSCSTLGITCAIGLFTSLALIVGGMNPTGKVMTRLLWTLPYYPAAVFCMLAATLGAFVSSLSRLQHVLTGKRGSSMLMEIPSGLGAWLSPFIGAISGFLLFMIFASNVLGNPAFDNGLFPKLIFKDAAHWTSVLAGIKEAYPDRTLDTAKLLLWAFVSGFSERFVPDLLGLVQQRTRPSTS